MIRLVLLTLLAAAIQQTPQSQTGTLEGTVTRMGATPVPIAGALVRATGNVSAEPRSDKPFTIEVFTDGAGHFTIRDAPPARYTIQVAADGYGVRTSNVSAVAPLTVVVTLAAGQRVQVPGLALLAAATIRGRVLDKDNRPMAGQIVEVLRLTTDEQGRREWVPIPAGVNNVTRKTFTSLMTDELGEYRHQLLGPGDYYVRTTLKPESSELPVTVYHPETAEARAASPIALTEGADMVADIRIGSALEFATYRISGRVAYPSAETGTLNTGLTLMERSSTSDTPATIRGLADEGGKFEFLDIRAGSYELFASVVIDEREYTAKVPLEVRDRDLEDVALALRPGADIKGQLIVDGEFQDISLARRPFDTGGRDPGRSRVGDVKIQLKRKDGLFFGTAPEPVLDERGTSFTFRDVPEGDYEFSITIVPDGRTPNPDLYIKDVRAGGRSVFDNGFQVGGDAVDAMEVIVGTGGGTIEGRILGTSGLVAAVILVPESFHRNNASLYRVTYRPRNGTFELKGLAPGNYKIFAVPYLNETVPYRSAEFLARHESRAASVTVQKGTTIGGVQVPFLSLGR